MEEINEKLQEFNNYIVNKKKVAIIGMGVSNIPLLDYFYKKNANVTICHKRNIEDLDKNVIEKKYLDIIWECFLERIIYLT